MCATEPRNSVPPPRVRRPEREGPGDGEKLEHILISVASQQWLCMKAACSKKALVIFHHAVCLQQLNLCHSRAISVQRASAKYLLSIFMAMCETLAPNDAFLLSLTTIVFQMAQPFRARIASSVGCCLTIGGLVPPLVLGFLFLTFAARGVKS